MQPISVSKFLSAASSNGLGSISTAATSVVTLNTSNFGSQARLVAYSTADASTLVLTFTGLNDGGKSVVETVVAATGSSVPAFTTQDFLSVSNVGFSSNLNIPIKLGVSSIGGTPWKVVDTFRNPINIGFGLTYSSTANAIQGQVDYTFDDPMNAIGAATAGTSILPASPRPVISTSISTAGSAANGYVNIPVAGWRMTLTSSSSGAGTAYLSVIQSG